jgi:hypothetical protein
VKLIARMHLIARAPLLGLFGTAFGLTLPGNVELRDGIGDSHGMQGGQDNDR